MFPPTTSSPLIATTSSLQPYIAPTQQQFPSHSAHQDSSYIEDFSLEELTNFFEFPPITPSLQPTLQDPEPPKDSLYGRVSRIPISEADMLSSIPIMPSQGATDTSAPLERPFASYSEPFDPSFKDLQMPPSAESTSCIHYRIDSAWTSSSHTTSKNRSNPWRSDAHIPSDEFKIATIASGTLPSHIPKASYPNNPGLQQVLAELRQVVKRKVVTAHSIDRSIENAFKGALDLSTKGIIRGAITRFSDLEKKEIEQSFPPDSLTSRRCLQQYMLDRFGKVYPSERIESNWTAHHNVCALHDKRGELSLDDLHALAVSYNENKPLPVTLHKRDIYKIKIARLCSKSSRSFQVEKKHLDHLKRVAQREGGIKIKTALLILQSIYGIDDHKRTDVPRLMRREGIPILKDTPQRKRTLEQSIKIVIHEIFNKETHDRQRV